jgi:hypothetical protein
MVIPGVIKSYEFTRVCMDQLCRLCGTCFEDCYVFLQDATPSLHNPCAVRVCVGTFASIYGPLGSSQLFVAYGGFILVYIGGLLSLEAAQQESGTRTVDVIQRVGLWLFALIASPAVLKLDSGDGNSPSLSRPQTELLLATLIDIAGYASVSYGFWQLCGKRPGKPLTVYSSSTAWQR